MQASVSSKPQASYQAIDKPINLTRKQQQPRHQRSRKSLIPVALLSAILFLIYHVTQLNKQHSAIPQQSFIQSHKKKDTSLFTFRTKQLVESLSIFLVSSFAITFDLLGGVGGPVILQIGYWILCDWGFIENPDLRVSVLLVYVGFMIPYLVQIRRYSKFTEGLFTPIVFGTSIAGGILGSFLLALTYDMIWVARSMGLLFLVTLLFHLIHTRFRSQEDDHVRQLDRDIEAIVSSEVFEREEFQISLYWLVIAGLVQGTLNGIYAAGGPAMNLYSTQYRTPTKMRRASMLIGFAFGNGLVSIAINGFAMGGFQNRDFYKYMSAFLGGILGLFLSFSCEGVLEPSKLDFVYRVFLGVGSVLMFSLGTVAGRVLGYMIGVGFFGYEIVFFTFIIIMSTKEWDEQWYADPDNREN